MISGAVLAGPLTSWFVNRHGLHGASGATKAPWIAPARVVTSQPETASLSIEQVMRTLLLIVSAVLLGDTLNTQARAAGLVLPGFLTAMLGGVLIINVADALRIKLAVGPIEQNGQVALRAFLAMYLMSLQLWALGGLIAPLAVNVLVQIVVTAAVAFLVLFRLEWTSCCFPTCIGTSLSRRGTRLAGISGGKKTANHRKPTPAHIWPARWLAD